jgi:hypothetical protein
MLRRLLWRGDLSPLGREAALNLGNSVVQVIQIQPSKGLLRSPTGINPLATMMYSQTVFDIQFEKQ